MMSKINTILFDIGDVLLPGRDPYQIWGDLIPEEKTRQAFLSSVSFKDWGQDWDQGTVSECLHHQEERYPNHANLIRTFAERWMKTPWKPFDDQTIALVRALKKKNYKLYIASNWPSDDFERARPFMPFLDLFDGLQISGQVHFIKPQPDFFRHMMQRFGFEAEEALFIDDIESNVEAARSLGLQGIVFQSAAQLRAQLVSSLCLPPSFFQESPSA